ncbi:MAG: hypothetical protein ABNH21_06770 [Glaciecola sp.]|jgi:hypothetical protein
MNLSNNHCHVTTQITEYCNQSDFELTSEDYLQCADYLVAVFLEGNSLSWDSVTLDADQVIGDYMADADTSFAEFKLMLTDPIAAQAQANKNLIKYAKDSIYKMCLTHEAFPEEYNMDIPA